MIRAVVLSLILMGALLGGCQQRSRPEEPVVNAVRENDVTTVSKLIDDGTDPNLKSRDGDPLIYVAAGPKGGLQVADLLIRRGANVDALTTEGRTALTNAVGWCDLPMVQLLLSAGADVRLAAGDGTLEDIACSGPLDKRAEVLALLTGSYAE